MMRATNERPAVLVEVAHVSELAERRGLPDEGRELFVAFRVYRCEVLLAERFTALGCVNGVRRLCRGVGHTLGSIAQLAVHVRHSTRRGVE